MRTLLLVDGNNIAHRAKYKFSLDNHGTDVSVTFGFIHILISYLRKFNPTSVVVAWDGGIPIYRRQRMPSYKANRTRHDEDRLAWESFYRQLEELRTVALPGMGIVNTWRKYIEADDILFHAAELAEPYYDRVVVVSNDKDLLQTVRFDKVLIFGNKDLVDKAWVESYTGVPIHDYLTWRAMQGDVSDNISGVVGIGPATATKLLVQYGHIQNVLDAAQKGKLGKVGDNLLSFGLQGIIDNVYIMSLGFDRCGARKTLADCIGDWSEANISDIKRYFLHNAFVSLMEPSIYSLFLRLQQPIINMQCRMPIVSGYRTAVT